MWKAQLELNPDMRPFDKVKKRKCKIIVLM